MTFVDASGDNAAQSNGCVQAWRKEKPQYSKHLATITFKKKHMKPCGELVSFMLSWLLYFIRYINSERGSEATSCSHNINGKRCCWHQQQWCQPHLYVKEIPWYQNIRLDPFCNCCQISASKVPNFKRFLTSLNLYSESASVALKTSELVL